MKRLIFLGGPMGVGKTTTAQALKVKLPNSVFLDGDWCWDMSPFQVTEETKAMVTDNICHLLHNFLRCSAYENVIFCWVMDHQEIIDGLLGRLELDGVAVWCFSLLCQPEALKDRLQKDLSQGRREAGCVERSLARLPLYWKVTTLKIETTEKSTEEVIEELVRNMGISL